MPPSMRVLANDGIAEDGKLLLEKAGFEVITEKIPQEQLASEINNYDVIVVRSATKVTAEIFQNATRLKLAVRAGVGIDNIDTKAGAAAGIAVTNTPNSSTLSVAELVFAHMFSIARFLFESNREMPLKGHTDFKELKKKYEKGFELRGKTLGIIGFGRIGQEVAKIAFGLGMKVVAYNRTPAHAELLFDHLPFDPPPVHHMDTIGLEEVLKQSDFISLHVPHKSGEAPLLSTKEFAMMKKGVVLINTARGGVINEKELMEALKSGQIAFAALDVFEGEPDISNEILQTPNISFSPHIGASTKEGQARVSKEVAETIIRKFENLSRKRSG
jgi:D-3-phosphoglycerate dehydrogenase / 2-oxoglutarate reductase